MAREAEHRVYTYAGPEIAVATTKGYCTQVAMLTLLALDAAYKRNVLDRKRTAKEVQRLCEDSVSAISEVLAQRADLQGLAKRIFQHENAFYIGRGLDYALSLEAALKLKEISYIHCEAYAAGELKHGTISLIEEGTPVVTISTEADLEEKILSNLSEVESRGSESILLARRSGEIPAPLRKQSLALPDQSVFASIFGCMTAIQLLAYEAAVLRECDVDRPRNLAKSVTVE